MISKKIVRACVVCCITAILGIAVCGCDDLGEYGNTEEYYDSFGDIVLIDGTSREDEEYSVKDYFYNKESRENFLAGKDGAYKGVVHGDYVYMAIPFENSIDMDTIALYMQSKEAGTVYINVFVTNKIPSAWKAIADLSAQNDQSGNPSDAGSGDGTNEEKTYDDPDPETRIGEVAVHLEAGKWGSFALDVFTVNGKTQKSIQIEDGQYILLQIRNNSGVRVFDEEKQAYVDSQTGLELQQVEFTATNLLIRALKVQAGSETQGGE